MLEFMFQLLVILSVPLLLPPLGLVTYFGLLGSPRSSMSITPHGISELEDGRLNSLSSDSRALKKGVPLFLCKSLALSFSHLRVRVRSVN